MRILCNILVVLFVTATAVGQQINPVPDYIFRNSMSVGRNAPTDTSAYFSIGPRFGATRGFMPPMVVDTAAVTGTKRNGLLIYSIQRNSFLYWDSTGSRWSRIAANLDTLQLSTRAWRQKGIDSVVSLVGSGLTGTGISGYIPKWTGTKALDTSQIRQVGGTVGIGTAPTNFRLSIGGGTTMTGGASIGSTLQVTGDTLGGAIILRNPQASPNTPASMGIYAAEFNQTTTGPNASEVFFQVAGPGTTSGSDGPFFAMRGNNFARFSNAKGAIEHRAGTITSPSGNDGAVLFTSPSSFIDMRTGSNFDSRLRITNAGESLFGTTTDAGDFRVQVAGGLYNTTGVALAASSGVVSIGSTADYGKLSVTTTSGLSGSTAYFNTFSTTSGAADTGPSLGFGLSNGSTLIDAGYINIRKSNGTVGNVDTYMSFTTRANSGGLQERVRITESGETLFGSTSDAGAYAVQITGGLYNTGNAVFNATSGESIFGGTTDVGNFKTQTIGNSYVKDQFLVGTSTSLAGLRGISVDDSTGALLNLASFRTATGAANTGPSIYFGAHNGTTAIDAGYIDLKKANGTVGNGETYMAFQTRSNSTGVGERLRITGDGETLIGYTADQGAYILQANGNGIFNGSLTTSAPNGGTAASWKLGIVVAGSYTAASNYLQVDVGGTLYYIGLVTPN
jgi:hypothetical protein